jgi:protein SCO1
MTQKFRIGILVVLIAITAAIAATGAIVWLELPSAASPNIGGPFKLTDANTGETVTDQTYRGKTMLIYFGYTYCPDACPTALNNISQAMAKLGPAAKNVVPLFISIDPARDTPKVMANYVKAFDPRIQGLVGDAATTAKVAKEFGVYYKRHDEPDGSYLMDHSSLIYVMDGTGKFLKFLPSSESGATLAGDLLPLVGSPS